MCIHTHTEKVIVIEIKHFRHMYLQMTLKKLILIILVKIADTRQKDKSKQNRQTKKQT